MVPQKQPSFAGLVETATIPERFLSVRLRPHPPIKTTRRSKVNKRL